MEENAAGWPPPRGLRLLLIEDDPADVAMIVHLLRGSGHTVAVFVVETQEAFEAELRRRSPDLILSDYRLPTFNGLAALEIVQRTAPAIPFIFVTGAMGEELAVETLKLGAADYILKSSLARLVPAVVRALREAQQRLEHERAGVALQRSHDLLRKLTARVQSVREEERTRIAREVHDELGQALTGVKLDLSWLAGHLASLPAGAAKMQRKLKALLAQIDGTIQSVRRIATELRPGVLDQLGLGAAIDWQASDFQSRSGIRCEVKISGPEAPLTAECQTACFRIFQETLTNIIRHAKATSVQVALGQADHQLLLTVRDNGRGISAAALGDARSIGLTGMKERAAQLGGEVIFSGRPPHGTTVSVRLPIGRPANAPGPT